MGLLLSIKLHLRRAKKALLKANLLKNYYMLITIESSAVAFFVASSFINMFRSNVMYLMISIGICAAVTCLRVAHVKTNEHAKNQDEKQMQSTNRLYQPELK